MLLPVELPLENVRKHLLTHMSEVTVMMEAIERGDPKAADELLALVYEELRNLATHKMAQEAPGPDAPAHGAGP